MSARRNTNSKQSLDLLRAEIDTLREQARAPVAASPTPGFETLSPVEQSAASLGIDPESYRPIAFMNEKHFDALKQNNMLSDDLARRIEAYRAVATSSS